MGNLRKYMPITFLTMLLGWLAICGIPIWAGFFSKDEILYKTFSTHTSAYDATLLGIHVNTILWVVGLLTAVLTAVYMTRLMVMTFFGNERFHQPIEDLPVAEDLDEASRAEENAFAMGDAHDAVEPHGDAHALAHAHEDEHDDDEDEEHHHHLPHDFKPHESPWVMTGPLIVLAVLSTLGGLVGIPYAMSSLFGAGDVNVFEHTLAPVIQKVGHKEIADKPTLKVEDSHATSSSAPKTESHSTDAEHVAHSPEEIRTERLLAGLSVLLAVGGIAIGWFVFMGNPLKKMPRILEQKWRIDELYNGYVVDPLTNVSRKGLWQGFDLGVIDGIVNGVGQMVAALGSVARGIQVGFVRSYAAFILFGALIVIGYFIYYGLKLIG